jgi:uncharacterized protein (TIGR00369 family)
MAEAKAPRADGPAELIGLEYLERSRDHWRARVQVTDAVRQPGGVVHGGVYSLIAESMCSRATWEAHDRRAAALGMSNSATFMRPISDGHVNAEARARHQGRMTWVWDVELCDDEGRVCALVRMTVAVRDLPEDEGE